MNLCKNGHDLDVVGVYSKPKQSPGQTKLYSECKRDRNDARKHSPPTPRERAMKARNVERALELRADADSAMPWDREKLIRQAEGLEGVTRA